MQIRPNAPFPIVYVLSDPSDTATYYVRSVVRNSATGAIIQISGINYVNLTVDASNSRRFSKLIQAPMDSSGSGFFIDITTTVYTNSGYTTKSDTYQEENMKYLVLEPWSVALGSGGGRGGYMDEYKIDYERIKKLFLEMFLELLPQYMVAPTDISPFISRMEDIEASIGSIPRPEPLKIDLEGHSKKIMDAHAKGLKSLKFPEFVPTDLTPILARFDNLKFPETMTKDEVKSHLQEMKDEINTLKEFFASHQKYTSLLDDVAGRFVIKEPKKDTSMGERIKSLMS